ncbi:MULTISPECIES: zinc ribbon domain-containing protein [Allobacillus]|nr:zinc ribbon domain-containing protein [Allobacillus salarius]
MRCPSCGTFIEDDVQFCPNCGENIEASIITIHSDEALPSENVYGVLKKIFRQPSASKHLTPNHLAIGLISIAIYSLLIAGYIYYSMKSISSNLQNSFNDLGLGNVLGQSVEVSFFDYFILPFVGFYALQIIMILLIFILAKISGEIKDLRALTAQYGGYLFPFSAIFLIGILFSVLNLNWLATVAFIIATLGVIFMLPAVLTKHGVEDKGGGTDRVYLLLIVYFIGVLILSFVARTYIETMVSSFINNITSIF